MPTDLHAASLHLPLRSVLSTDDAFRVIRRSVAFIFMFLALAVLCFHRQGPSGIDRAILSGYVATKSTIVFRVANVVTLLGSPAIVVVLGIVVAIFVWFRQGSMAWTFACLAAPGIAGVAESTLKMVVRRTRPLTAVLTGEHGNGFPSGHAAGFASLVFIIAFMFEAGSPVHRNSTMRFLLAGAAALAMAVTRVLVGAHFPTDVTAGVLVGVVCADLTAFTARSSDVLVHRFRSAK